MEDRYHLKLFLLFFIFTVFIVGGYVLMIQSTKKDNKTITNNNSTVKNIDIRIDNTHEYIYYSDEEIVTEELDINYVNVNLNFKDDSKIASKLNEIKNNLKKDIKYDKSNGQLPYNGLIYAKYPLYEDYTYKNYLSLVANYYTFDSENLVSYINSDCYVFDKNTGKLLSSEDLLNEYNLNESKVKEIIKDSINNTDLINGDITLDTKATLDNVKLDSLYIDKLGRLVISILVKSSEKDYNEVIILS